MEFWSEVTLFTNIVHYYVYYNYTTICATTTNHILPPNCSNSPPSAPIYQAAVGPRHRFGRQKDLPTRTFHVVPSPGVGPLPWQSRDACDLDFQHSPAIYSKVVQRESYKYCEI